MTGENQFRIRWWHYLKFVPWTAVVIMIGTPIFFWSAMHKVWGEFVKAERDLWNERNGRE